MSIETDPSTALNEPSGRAGEKTYHPLHRAAVLAAHSRPPLPVHAPATIDHAILLVGELESGQGDPSDAERSYFVETITEQGWTIAQQSSSEILAISGNRAIKWERHTEFLAVTLFASRAEVTQQFEDASTDFDGIIGHLIRPISADSGVFARMRITVLSDDAFPEQNGNTTDAVSPAGYADPTPENQSLIKVLVNGGAVCVATDLRHDANGVVPYRVTLNSHEVAKLPPARIGRLVQRLIEIESYRLLAYLAVPETQKLGARVSALEAKVNRIAERTAAEPEPEEEAAILTELTSLSAELQSIGSASEFRFAASLAYSAIVDRRLSELREGRIEAYQRLSTAIKRRLDPAMRSCEALLARQQKIAERIGNISELLRTRVDLTLQDQNSAVLRSIDARADAQLRLQQTVEGLSVAAITYYTLGIIGYLVKGSPIEALGLSKTALQALLVVPVGLLVYFGLKKIRNNAHAQHPENQRKKGRSEVS